MNIIGYNDIANLHISPYRCYEWVCEGLNLKPQSILPPKISLKPSEGVFYNTMPVLIPKMAWGGKNSHQISWERAQSTIPDTVV